MADESLFAQATDWLSQHGVQSIDWNALAARRQDSVRSTQYMDQYLLPAFNRAAAVVDTLDLPRAPPDDVLHAYAVLSSDVASLGDKALEIARINVAITKTMLFPTSTAELGLKLEVGMYGLFIYHLWSSALTAGNAHISARIHKSGIPDPDIAYHASLTTMCFNLIYALDHWGLLAPLKKRSTSGLGAVQLGVGAIIIGVVLAIAIVWALVAIYQMSLRQKVVEKVCDQAIQSGDPVEMKRCDDLINNPEANLAGEIPKAFGNVLEKVAITAMVGAGVYMLVLFGPGIATKVKQTMAAWRTS